MGALGERLKMWKVQSKEMFIETRKREMLPAVSVAKGGKICDGWS